MIVVHIHSPSFRIAGVTITAWLLCLALSVLVAWGFIIFTCIKLAMPVLWALVQLPIALLSQWIGETLNQKLLHRTNHVLYFFLIPFWALQLGLIALNMPALIASAAIIATGFGVCIGRLGCLVQGCCHGKVASWGIRYKNRLGIARLPVQLVESAWALCITLYWAFPLATMVQRQAAIHFISWYAAGRLLLEFMRGDFDRMYWHGLSEAQWISIVLMSGAGLTLYA
jgi:hypothetical protein